MPMEKPEDFGTDAKGFRVDDYCHYCFTSGAFTTPDLSLPAMIDICVAAMTQRGVMPAREARTLMNDLLPRLKRWQSAA